jgi:hypothetical protein
MRGVGRDGHRWALEQTIIGRSYPQTGAHGDARLRGHGGRIPWPCRRQLRAILDLPMMAARTEFQDTEQDLKSVTATRYVTPLREGGSLPAIIEADDEGLYVLKFRGAGQGPRALIAELLAGEIARLLGLPVPDIAFVQLDGDLARTEPDAEVQDLIRRSAGLNIALDYLPGSITFDPVVFRTDVEFASRLVWFDAFVCNVDRTARNVNLLMWHGKPWLIDHGAALYFHHAWKQGEDFHAAPFSLIKDHVMLGAAAALEQADAHCRPRLPVERLAALVQTIPGEWLEADSGFAGPQAQRDAYLRFFTQRVQNSHVFLQEALRARAAHV